MSSGYNQNAASSSQGGRKTATTRKVKLSSQGKIPSSSNNNNHSNIVAKGQSGKQARPPTLLLAVDSSIKLALSVNNNERRIKERKLAAAKSKEMDLSELISRLESTKK